MPVYPRVFSVSNSTRVVCARTRLRRDATGETEVVHGKGYVTLHEGDVIILVGAGVGGFGLHRGV